MSQVNHISLNHPHAKLVLTAHDDGSYEAKIVGLHCKEDLLRIAAESLARRPRFGAQLRKDFSVLEHCFFMGKYLESIGADPFVAKQAYLHDIPEAFLGDMPSPFKGELDKKREQAVALALPYSEIHGEISPEVKKLDYACLLAEAEIFGYPEWDWLEPLRDEKEAHQYKWFLERFYFHVSPKKFLLEMTRFDLY